MKIPPGGESLLIAAIIILLIGMGIGVALCSA